MALDALQTLIQKLFGPESSLHPASATSDITNRYVVVYSGGLPRWLIPANPTIGLAVLEDWQPFSRRARIAWKSLLALYRRGWLGYLPNVKAVQLDLPEAAHPAGTLASQIPDLKTAVPVAYISPPYTTAKAVIAWVNTNSGKPVALSKVPLGERAGKRIEHEAQSMELVARLKPGLAPQLLHLETDRLISYQSWLPGKLLPAEFTDAHMRWLSDLRNAQSSRSLSEEAGRLGYKLSQLESVSPKDKSLIESAISRLDSVFPLPCVIQHGDFAPWNLKSNGDNGLIAVDWEYADEHGLPMLDLIHFHYIQKAFDRHRLTLLQLQQLPSIQQMLQCWTIPESLLPQLFLTYLTSRWLLHAAENHQQQMDIYASDLRLFLSQFPKHPESVGNTTSTHLPRRQR